ncbi:hypothetical protein MNBD_UNCLBAC01-1517 [hydrothermal vent metagenome]|uniref:Endonuclease GajA/Old nuclease/RecF-like AAA domain-containing protein n=1 Tax=hydrothermal vent metagenome TaxID=652676 RepID=A0A3B1D4M6_9ZZZZ
MNFIRFRIQNYKSIIDSGYCDFSSDLTILIGKNESGKSATLEALYDFGRDVSAMSNDAFPIDGRLDDPLIEIHFKVEPQELKEMQRKANVAFSENVIQNILKEGLIITKNGKGVYALNHNMSEGISDIVKHDEILQSQAYKPEILTEEMFSEIGVCEGDVFQSITTAKDRLAELLQDRCLPDLNVNAGQEEVQKSSKEIFKIVKSVLPMIKDESIQNEVLKNVRIIIKGVHGLNNQKEQVIEKPTQESVQNENSSNEHNFRQEDVIEQKNLDEGSSFNQKDFLSVAIKHLPRFVYLRESSDILPFEIDIADIKQNQAVCDFAKISGLDLDQFVATTDIQKRINILNRHSAVISGDFFGYWEQNTIEMVVRSEGSKLLFAVKDAETTDLFKVAQRSKGFQWFLSFYLRLNAQVGQDSLIIIDEPGQNLHAKAQKELIKILTNKIAKKTHVIFTTHSPYLIDPERLDRIRVVIKDSRLGSVIRKDIEHITDEDSLMPLATTTGKQKVEQPVALNSKRNVILGDMASYYYIKALSNLVMNSKFTDINFIPSIDRDHMVQFISILLGQNADTIILLEQNKKGQDIARELQSAFSMDEDRIIFMIDKLDSCVEDVLTQKDFNSYVLGEDQKNIMSLDNSKFVKEQNLDRVILAKGFLNKVEKTVDLVELSQETRDTVKTIFNKILRGFHEAIEEVRDEIQDENKEGESVENFDFEIPPEPRRRSLFSFLKEK